MPVRVVLLPFPRAASFEHLVSTRGGNSLPGTQRAFDAAKALYEEQVNFLTKYRLPLDPDVLKQIPDFQGYAAKYHKIKEAYESTLANLNRAMKRGWKNIDPLNVVCTDSIRLTLALGELQAADDTLFIRGHCAAGSSVLESADHSMQITVNQLVGILDHKLDKKFRGKIKIFGCESGKNTVTSYSFAKQFATQLSVLGWINCTFYGFKENLREFVDDVSGCRQTESKARAHDAKELIQVPTQHIDSQTSLTS